MSASAAAVVRKEIPAKIKTYLAFGLWIMEKTMTEEEARNKMIEMFIGSETVDAICGKFEAFNEKEMVEKLVQIHKSLKPKPTKKKTEKKTTIESPNNIVNELVSLATNAVPENAEDVLTTPPVPKAKPTEDKAKPTEDKKKRAAPKAKTVPVVETVAPVVENVAPVVETVAPVVENVAPVVENVAPSTSDVKKKRVVKPKTKTETVVTETVVTETVVPSVTETVVTETVVTETVVTENAVPSAVAAVKAPKKKATPKAKATSENVVPSATEEKAASENVVPSAVDVVKAPKKKATPKAKATSENVVPSATEEKPTINEVVTSEVKTSENVVPSATEDKKKKQKEAKAPVIVESPKNDVGAPEEFEDTELVVKEFVYGTKSYYIDEEQTIYEQEGLKKIGKLVNGKLVFNSV